MATIWVGDFRSIAMQAFIANSDYTYLLEDSADCQWFNDTASKQLSRLLSDLDTVIVAVGFNDCANSCIWSSFNIDTIATKFATAINSLITKYSNTNFYVCSVNPVEADYATAFKDNGVLKKNDLNDKIKQFNTKLKNACKAKYLDTYSYLADTSFSTSDGVRFTKETCNSIFQYISSFQNDTPSASFKPRTSAPAVSMGNIDSDAYWLGDSYGGLNPFDNLSGQLYKKCDGDTLPNCTAYAWGRFYEILGTKPKLSLGNAEQWYLNTSDGYQRGQTPALGAVICWQKGAVTGTDGAGHVGIVEKINADGSIVTSESGWNDSRYWWTRTRTNADGQWGAAGSAYKFQGFIYNPRISAPETTTSTRNYTLTRAMSKADVISSNAWLTTSQMQVNARYIWNYLGSKGWSRNAVAGLLGNMQTESKMNPGIWQGLKYGNMAGGFGLVQWTPATKLINWCNNRGLSYTDIDAQLQRIIWERDNPVAADQYYSTSEYPISFATFSTSTLSADYLARAFLRNYERSWTVLYGTASQKAIEYDTRGSQGTYWYNYLLKYAPEAPITPPISTPTKPNLPPLPTVTPTAPFIPEPPPPPFMLLNFKTDIVAATSVNASFITANAKTGSYKITNSSGSKVSEGKITVSDTDSDVKVATFSCNGLTPNTKYKLSVSVTGKYSSSTLTELISFTTEQDYPKTLSSVSLKSLDAQLPYDNFQLTTSPTNPDFGYWKSKGSGYTIQLIVNGKLVSEKDVSSLPKTFKISKYFNYKTKIGDIVQIGIRTWTKYNSKKIYDAEYVKMSNPICTLVNSFIVYLNTD